MKAIIFGATGQAASYMSELLAREGVDVKNISRDLVDFWLEQKVGNIMALFSAIFAQERPDFVFNFAAKLKAPDVWDNPSEYLAVNGTAVVAMLQAMSKACPKARFFQAGSADVFDLKNGGIPQTESTQRGARDAYGLSKLMAEQAVKFYRDKFELFACTGIFFTMESPRRRDSFARDVVKAVVAAKRKLADKQTLAPIKFGPLLDRRDWGWTPEYMEAVWKMVRAAQPRDYVIGTGADYSCLELVSEALKVAGLPTKDMLEYPLNSNATTMRSSPLKIYADLGWKAKYTMPDVVRMLVDAELGKGISA